MGDAFGQRWEQQAMFEDEFGVQVVEITLRIGLIPQMNHLRWQVESSNPVTKELLSMFSVQHVDTRHHVPKDLLIRMVDEVEAILRSHYPW